MYNEAGSAVANIWSEIPMVIDSCIFVTNLISPSTFTSATFRTYAVSNIKGAWIVNPLSSHPPRSPPSRQRTSHIQPQTSVSVQQWLEEQPQQAMASVPTPPGTSGLAFFLCVFLPSLHVSPTSSPSSTAQTLFAAFGGILFGYDTGVISGIQTMQNWLCTFGKPDPLTGVCAITSSQQSLVVSILSAGNFFGALFAAPTADILGRRWSVVLAVAIFAAGVAMQAAASALPLFIAGRVFAGWGVGMVSMLIPMYQSECSPKWIR